MKPPGRRPARRIDLHAHTTHSDGTLAPAELVGLAHARGLSALAVTDHDTLSALPEAHRVGAALGVEILDGCEITARMGDRIAHVLAYAFDQRDPGLVALLALVREGRDARNHAIHERLDALGVPLKPAEVARHAVGRIIARPHFARALVEKGHALDLRQAFDRYLRDGGPAYVVAPVPPAADVVAAVVAAGGVAVVAHPRSLGLDGATAYEEALRPLVDRGLAGMEVDHPSQNPPLRALLAAVAQRLGLVRSGGSDFHGASKPHIDLGTGDGTIDVRYDTWERLRARRDGHR